MAASSSRCLVLITGSSRGFGKCLALEAARTFGTTHGLDLHLIARSAKGLASTKEVVVASTSNAKVSKVHESVCGGWIPGLRSDLLCVDLNRI